MVRIINFFTNFVNVSVKGDLLRHRSHYKRPLSVFIIYGMKHTLIKICLSILLLSAGVAAHAQSRGAIKTNFVPDALASPNLGIEIGLTPQWTLDISGEVNLWEVNRHKW